MKVTSLRPVLAPPGGGRFDAIIFDMGGTLLEFENVSWEALYPSSVTSLHQWLSRDGHRLPPYDDFLTRFEALLQGRRDRCRPTMREYQISPLLRDLMLGFGITLRKGGISAAVDAYYAAVRRQVSAFPESRPTLARLRELGYCIGLLSNTPFRVLDHRQELVHHGLWEYFDATLFTSTVTYRKPHPAPFKTIAERLKVSPERALYIGDRQREDVQGPQGAGMTACLVRRPRKPYEAGLTRSCEIETLDELIDRLGHVPGHSAKTAVHDTANAD